jgi:hypothetical protein
MINLSNYEDWCAVAARATQLILGSLKVKFAMDLVSLSSTQVMWERATSLPVEQPHPLHLHLGASKLLSIAGLLYRYLLPLAYCWAFDCHHLRQQHDSVLCLHEFFGCLRLKFEQLRAQLLSHSPLSSMVEAITVARAEEICLRVVLSSSTIVLAALTGSTSSTYALVMSSTPPLALLEF